MAEKKQNPKKAQTERARGTIKKEKWKRLGTRRCFDS